MSNFYFSYEPDDEMKQYSHAFTYSEEFDENFEHISNFHKFCRRIAALYGYTPSCIDEYFGEETENPLLD